MYIPPKKPSYIRRKGFIFISAILFLLMASFYYKWGVYDEKNVVANQKTESPNLAYPTNDYSSENNSPEKSVEYPPLPEKNVPNGEDEVGSKEPKKYEQTHQELENQSDKEQPKELGNVEPDLDLQIGKVVYLTFDDGPHAISTNLLQLLKKYNAKATFFLLEPNMKRYPEVVKQMVLDGHTVGVHGVSHDKEKIYQSDQSFIAEMEQAIDCFYDETDYRTNLIRAPYGSNPYMTESMKEAAKLNGFILWDWNIDSNDWKYHSGEFVDDVINQTLDLVNKQPLVVLLHEKPSTLEYLEELLQFYSNEGYIFSAISNHMDPIQF